MLSHMQKAIQYPLSASKHKLHISQERAYLGTTLPQAHIILGHRRIMHQGLWLAAVCTGLSPLQKRQRPRCHTHNLCLFVQIACTKYMGCIAQHRIDQPCNGYHTDSSRNRIEQDPSNRGQLPMQGNACDRHMPTQQKSMSDQLWHCVTHNQKT
jgi:hypothetical protein